MKKIDGFRYSPSAGKWVEVDEPPAKPSAKQRRLGTAYAQVGLKEAATAFKAARADKGFVWIWLQYLAWKKKSATFPLPNDGLEQYGITRNVKYRALRDYVRAGLITIQQEKKQSVTVTLHTARWGAVACVDRIQRMCGSNTALYPIHTSGPILLFFSSLLLVEDF